jgi:1-aminocyclopropane-1-carboxylate deaminase
MSFFLNQKSVNQILTTLDRFEITLKREDLLHPTVSGNKLRKLKYNLQQAKAEGQNTLLTFGGPFSNHLAATATAAKLMGFRSIGVVRGDESRILNPTLQYCKAQAMNLYPVSRADYLLKNQDQFIDQIHHQFGDFYLIPEGGTNTMAIKGCKEILTEEDAYFDVIACSVGTGGTLAGLIESALSHQKVVGFSALRNQNLATEIKKWTLKQNWSLIHDYTFGGYAKITPDLIYFMNTFNKNFKTLLDPVYTAKLLFGIFELIKNKQWSAGKKILIIHTGGIQGIEGMNQKLTKKKWPKIIV